MAEEYDFVSKIIDMPHTCFVFTRHQSREAFYDRHEWLIKYFA